MLPTYCRDLELIITYDVCIKHIKLQEKLSPTCISCLEKERLEIERMFGEKFNN